MHIDLTFIQERADIRMSDRTEVLVPETRVIAEVTMLIDDGWMSAFES
jgi:hypothetical protein